MLYRPIWWCLNFYYRVFMRRAIVSGIDNWLSDKPVINPINHVNAFLDPVIVPPLKWQKVHYIVRGDVFKNNFVAWVLWQMNQIPMFRQRDGATNMKKNQESFDRCYDLLKKNERIFIFSEGDCVQEKHLRSIKKGTARMAFGAIDKHGWDIDLHFLPFTVNYSHPAEPRFEMMVKFGEPIPLSKYKELYEEDPARAITRVTRELEQAMKDVYVCVEQRDDLKVLDQLLEIERNNHTYPKLKWLYYADEPFDREKNIANRINQTREEDLEKLDKIKEDAADYYRNLKKLGIKDRDFSEYQPNLFLNAILAVIGLPFFLLAALFFGAQTYFADNMAEENQTHSL